MKSWDCEHQTAPAGTPGPARLAPGAAAGARSRELLPEGSVSSALLFHGRAQVFQPCHSGLYLHSSAASLKILHNHAITSPPLSLAAGTVPVHACTWSDCRALTNE